MQVLPLDELVRTLEAMSPMPADEDMLDSPELIDRYVEVVDAIRRATGPQLHAQVLVALLQAFGLGDGFEGYWTTLHYIESLRPTEEAYQLIREAAHSTNAGTRQWCTLLLVRRCNPADLPLFIALLEDATVDVVYWALLGIRRLATASQSGTAIAAVERLLQHPDQSVVEAAHSTMETLIR